MSRKDKFIWRLIEGFIRFKELVREFPELIGLPIVTTIFYFSDRIFYLFDKDSVPWSFDTLGSIILVSVIVLAINCLSFVGFKLNFPSLYKKFLDLDYSKCSELEIILLSLGVLLVYITMFMLVFLTIIK